MASTSFLPEEEFSCPVCHEIFCDPVLLSCSHSFCKTCVLEYWKEKTSRDCPVCRQRCSMDEPPCNLVLKNLCDALRERGSQRSSAGSDLHCSLHNEKLKLFCLEDKEPICLVCQTSRKHRSHSCVPVDEAAQDYREELQTALNPLEEKLKELNKVKLTCNKTADHIKTQTEITEKQINEEFRKLHQFLQKEEEARIAALRKEGDQKKEKMKEKIKGINREIESFSDTIKAIKEQLRAGDTSFLKNFKVTYEKSQASLPDPQPVSGVLIDVAKHLGNLTFRVWKKMKGMVRHTPVILDPNTANSCLSLSEDLTTVRKPDTQQQLPDNPERFMKSANVLGSEGFSSGKHNWEVEVGDHPSWNMGVVKESVDRKGELYATPEYGIWALLQRSGTFEVGGGGTLTLQRRPQRIRVELDYDKGELFFYDSKDMTHIYTFKHKFTERVFPFFSIGKAGDSKNPDIQICQSELSLTVKSSK